MHPTPTGQLPLESGSWQTAEHDRSSHLSQPTSEIALTLRMPVDGCVLQRRDRQMLSQLSLLTEGHRTERTLRLEESHTP